MDEKCVSLHWSSCAAGRSAAAASRAPERVLNLWRSRSLWTSGSDWSLSFHCLVTSPVPTPFHSPRLFSRLQTQTDFWLLQTDKVPLSLPWGHPHPIDHGTGNERWKDCYFHIQIRWKWTGFFPQSQSCPTLQKEKKNIKISLKSLIHVTNEATNPHRGNKSLIFISELLQILQIPNNINTSSLVPFTISTGKIKKNLSLYYLCYTENNIFSHNGLGSKCDWSLGFITGLIRNRRWEWSQ